jgi:hypothetical protein
VRRDQERGPPDTRQHPAEGGQDDLVGRSILDPLTELAFQDVYLVAQDHDLELFVELRPAGPDDELQDPVKADVGKG